MDGWLVFFCIMLAVVVITVLSSIGSGIKPGGRHG